MKKLARALARAFYKITGQARAYDQGYDQGFFEGFYVAKSRFEAKTTNHPAGKKKKEKDAPF